MTRLFDLIIIADWSAAARPGPAKPSADRCWIAWSSGGTVRPAEYFRTRDGAISRIEELLRGLLQEPPCGRAFVGFDFAFGYPQHSDLGGGRQAAARLAALVTDDARDANNRFDVAGRLNDELSPAPGPFWGCPPSRETSGLPLKKPPFAAHPFKEYRLVERHLRERDQRPFSVWQLAGAGSVGSQTLVGLANLSRLLTAEGLAAHTLVWPFDTGWDENLGDRNEGAIVYGEVWPSLADHGAVGHPVKDARQVLALCGELTRRDDKGDLRRAFARPAALGDDEAETCLREEGWILGVA